MDNELLKAISEMMDEKLKPIKDDLAGVKREVGEIKDDLAELKEEHSMTREAVNKLLEWSETAGYIIHFPLDKRNISD